MPRLNEPGGTDRYRSQPGGARIDRNSLEIAGTSELLLTFFRWSPESIRMRQAQCRLQVDVPRCRIGRCRYARNLPWPCSLDPDLTEWVPDDTGTWDNQS